MAECRGVLGGKGSGVICSTQHTRSAINQGWFSTRSGLSHGKSNFDREKAKSSSKGRYGGSRQHCFTCGATGYMSFECPKHRIDGQTNLFEV